ncbi:hypothetical protein Dvina_22830 [Dactylosporangium vinaceum]|uniref:Transposase n=1 Tax=Dactylosporangium vinaceum TaxID=53362 RepID=A0ABV5MSE6_9ACTN|nr:hypothetical protein [Dactylosporangium vinaceum]UAC00635.1 hypothetical protein Dvina_22830 [Dactylosporangium vinaceum]
MPLLLVIDERPATVPFIVALPRSGGRKGTVHSKAGARDVAARSPVNPVVVMSAGARLARGAVDPDRHAVSRPLHLRRSARREQRAVAPQAVASRAGIGDRFAACVGGGDEHSCTGRR